MVVLWAWSVKKKKRAGDPAAPTHFLSTHTQYRRKASTYYKMW
jgi:hypothetical protein